MLTEKPPKPMAIPLMPEDRRARQGAWLLIASLGVFFFSSMFLYVVYIYLRLQGSGFDRFPLKLPISFVASTLLLIGISITLHFSVAAARSDRYFQLIQLLAISLAMAIGFFVVQFDGMSWLVKEVWRIDDAGSNAYAFTFLLALIHALHVVGGLVAMIWVFVNAIRGKYDHERNYGIQFCGLYWHFLDVVWILMLCSFITASCLIGS